MDRDELDELSRASIADRSLARAERKRLGEWLDANAGDENDRAFARHRMFEMARSANDPALFDWLEQAIKLTIRPTRIPEAIAATSRAFFSPGEDCLNEVTRQLELARQQVDIRVSTITDDRISRAIEKVHRRGVRVRIVSDDDKARDLGSDIFQPRQAGVPRVIDVEPGHRRHKFALLDRVWLLTGSFNWTRSATRENEENLIVTDDPGLVAPFSQRFELLWRRLSDPRPAPRAS
jgi:phosphatidylserine/phosphatidylglycerophosphate/cardiolipin synthase-like enzyme